MPGQQQSAATNKSKLIASQSSLTQQKNFINSANKINSNSNLSTNNHVIDCEASDLGNNRGDSVSGGKLNKNLAETAMHHHHQQQLLHQQSSGSMLKNLLTSSSIMKKQGVSAESCDVSGQRSTDILITKYDKDFR